MPTNFAWLCAALVVLIMVFIYAITDLPMMFWRDVQPMSRSGWTPRTGDVLVLHNSGITSRMIRFYEHTPASHVAMIVVEDGVVWVCDLDLRNTWGYDAHVERFDKFMTYNHNIIGVIPVVSELPVKLSQIRAMQCKFDVTLSFVPLPERVVCSTFVHRIQRRYGVHAWTRGGERECTPAVYHSDPGIMFLDYGK